MRGRWNEHRYTFSKRNGKDCYIWFEIRDYYGETIFKSSIHKVSLNVYRLIVIRHYLRSHCLYI